MTQATTWGVPVVGPVDPVTMATRILDSLNALKSGHRGASRPSYVEAGTIWVKEVSASAEEVYFFDGAEDRLILTVNPTSGAVSFAGLGTAAQATLGTGSGQVPTADQIPSLAGSSGHGQCRLAKSGANLVLSPFNGNKLVINGATQSVPGAGVSLAPTSLTHGTTYFIYAYMDSGTMTLEASTTGHATHTDGVEIKSGDPTRTLVGMARCVTGPAWADSATQRLVLSYFNRRSIAGNNGFTSTRSTTSTSYVEVNSEIRVEFLTWADEAVEFAHSGSAFNTSASTATYTSLGVDSTVPEDVFVQVNMAGASGSVPAGASCTHVGSYAEGYHYTTLLGKVSGGTGSWYGGAAGSRSTLKLLTRG